MGVCRTLMVCRPVKLPAYLECNTCALCEEHFLLLHEKSEKRGECTGDVQDDRFPILAPKHSGMLGAT